MSDVRLEKLAGMDDMVRPLDGTIRPLLGIARQRRQQDDIVRA